MRWLFHVARSEEIGWGKDGRYVPRSLDEEGFVHASFKGALHDSALRYFPDAVADAAAGRLRVLAIDPRRLDVPVDVVETPRGAMPHIRGSVPVDAVRMIDLGAVEDHADEVMGTHVGFLAYEGMTLLDLVGPLDALSRIASMGFDPTASCEVVALTKPEDDPTVVDVGVWSGWGAQLTCTRYRPALDGFDLLVVPGGPGARSLVKDRELCDYLASFPENRTLASVCTGSLLLGAIGRLDGRRATTHASFVDELERYGATAVRDERVVDEGSIVTSGGVTAGIELGLHLVERLTSRRVADVIAKQMEVRT